jgi:hypothetical protein
VIYGAFVNAIDTSVLGPTQRDLFRSINNAVTLSVLLSNSGVTKWLPRPLRELLQPTALPGVHQPGRPKEAHLVINAIMHKLAPDSD